MLLDAAFELLDQLKFKYTHVFNFVTEQWNMHRLSDPHVGGEAVGLFFVL